MQEYDNTDLQTKNVQNKLPQVVGADAVINPGAVTACISL